MWGSFSQQAVSWYLPAEQVNVAKSLWGRPVLPAPCHDICQSCCGVLLPLLRLLLSKDLKLHWAGYISGCSPAEITALNKLYFKLGDLTLAAVRTGGKGQPPCVQLRVWNHKATRGTEWCDSPKSPHILNCDFCSGVVILPL